MKIGAKFTWPQGFCLRHQLVELDSVYISIDFYEYSQKSLIFQKVYPVHEIMCYHAVSFENIKYNHNGYI